MTRAEKERMLAGELYDASAPELQAELVATHEWLASVGEGAVIRPPFHCATASTSALARVRA